MSFKKKLDLPRPSINLLSVGSELRGDVTINGDFRIDGKIYGNIYSDGKLTIGTSAYIEGKIECQTAEIFGEINGVINSSGLIILKSNSKFIGDIKTESIMVELGSNVRMTCNTMENIDTLPTT